MAERKYRLNEEWPAYPSACINGVNFDADTVVEGKQWKKYTRPLFPGKPPQLVQARDDAGVTKPAMGTPAARQEIRDRPKPTKSGPSELFSSTVMAMDEERAEAETLASAAEPVEEPVAESVMESVAELVMESVEKSVPEPPMAVPVAEPVEEPVEELPEEPEEELEEDFEESEEEPEEELPEEELPEEELPEVPKPPVDPAVAAEAPVPPVKVLKPEHERRAEEAEAAKKAKEMELVDIRGVAEGRAKQLMKAGFKTVKSVAEVSPSDLLGAIRSKGARMNLATAKAIVKSAQELLK